MRENLNDKGVKKVKRFGILPSKLFVFFAFVLIFSVGVLAFFTFSYDKDVTYQVVGSQGDLLILVDLSDQVFNVSESLNNSQNLTVVNQNGAAPMNYVINIDVTNLDPGNCTLNNDVSFELSKDAMVILNSTNFTMDPGVNNFEFKSIAINNRVCLQNITTSLTFSEI